MVALCVTAALIGIAVMLAGLYNGLVVRRNRYKNAYAQIDVQLKRRYDLIPNLIEAAKAYLSHERETLEAVITARNQAVSASASATARPGEAATMTALAAAEGSLGTALSRLFALQEAYPELKADRSIAEVSEALRSAENKVAFARQAFNDAITAYNVARERFPAVLFAGSFGFQAASLLAPITQAEERAAPKVDFS